MESKGAGGVLVPLTISRYLAWISYMAYLLRNVVGESIIWKYLIIPILTI